MAKKDQVIENKTFGDKIKFLVTAADSKGALMRAELRVKPGGEGPPEHFHPVQTESFEVIKGELTLNCDGHQIVLKPGEKYTVPPDTAHKWSNRGNEELIVVGELKPALKTEFFLETLYSLDVQGKTNKKGLPSFLQFAAMLNECYGELFVVGQPIAAQKFMAKVVGGFAKLVGYKGNVPFPEVNAQ